LGADGMENGREDRPAEMIRIGSAPDCLGPERGGQPRHQKLRPYTSDRPPAPTESDGDALPSSRRCIQEMPAPNAVPKIAPPRTSEAQWRSDTTRSKPVVAATASAAGQTSLSAAPP